jgi:hypothetical protein
LVRIFLNVLSQSWIVAMLFCRISKNSQNLSNDFWNNMISGIPWKKCFLCQKTDHPPKTKLMLYIKLVAQTAHGTTSVRQAELSTPEKSNMWEMLNNSRTGLTSLNMLGQMIIK